MKKLLTLLVGLFVVFLLCLGSIATILLISSTNVEAQSRDTLKTPEDYEDNNVYYLCSPTITSTVHYLKGVPIISDGSNPDLNKAELENGAPEYFTYPGQGQRKAKLIYNQTFNGNPYIQLTLNSYESSDKVVNVEIGVDIDNDDNFEIVCTFPPYHTTGDVSDGTMEEEVFEAFGEWQGGYPPAYIEGWLKMKITMTSPLGDPALLYCGFDNKLSWTALPYMHTDLLPRAQINKSFLQQGFIEEGRSKVTVGDLVWFDGRDSYDPNDDLNGNKKIDAGEVDRLKYRWRFGDASATKLNYENRNVSHIYPPDSIQKTVEYSVFEVNLTVMDQEGHTDWNRTYIKVYRGNHSPEIISLKINNFEQIKSENNMFPKVVESPLDQSIKVYFNALATDKDGDDVTYHWDFDEDFDPEAGTGYEIEGDVTVASSVSYQFSEPKWRARRYTVTLVVSDGTTVENTSATGNVTFTVNEHPISVIRAKKFLDPVIYQKNITVKTGETIIFDSSLSYDPDKLPGFDTDNDRKPNFPLKYRWNFNAYDSSATSGWITETTYEHRYLSAGTEYKYIITLTVDDGLNINTSTNFTVFVNVRPMAKIKIKPISYNPQGNFEVGRPIHFNGSASYDPNEDKIVNYTWDFGDGNKSYGPEPIHVYSTPSEYTVSLIIEDHEFASTPDQIKVDIPFPPEKPILKYKVYPLETFTLKDIHFDASKTYDPDSDFRDLKFKWNFGDNITSTISNTTHRYLEDGDYLITLEVTDETGAKATRSEIVVHIKNRKPIARIKPMKNVPAGENVRVSGTDSRDEDGSIVRYLWSFGDGTDTTWTNESTVEHKWKHATTY
ncbi:MAG: PKD domain-containing protein, partial [Thermoplasmata archaeon]|nr:PKD domain-containing protein [Thermoplasmata archaeon]